MNRLLYAIAYTNDLDGMKRHYRDAVGLPIAHDTPYFVSFHTGATSFAIMMVHPGQRREIELCFESQDIKRDVAALRSRGVVFEDAIKRQPFGKLIHARDPEGTLVTLLEPEIGVETAARAPAGTPQMRFAIVNARDMAGAKRYYRERLGLHPRVDSPGWVEFGLDGAGLALHRRDEEEGTEQHHAQPITLSFAIPDLPGWSDGARARGVRFVAAPMDAGWGLMADAVDPDGNVFVLHELSGEPAIEEALAQPFEDDIAPRRAAIRKPVVKAAKAVSRVAQRPAYKTGAKKKATRGRKAAEKRVSQAAKEARAASKRLRVASPRGTGPAGTRAKPKRLADPKRARNRPAVGRLKKAERGNVQRKKRAVARTSKSRPVKGAVARRGRG